MKKILSVFLVTSISILSCSKKSNSPGTTNSNNKNIVTTVAGGLTAGNVDGAAAVARFNLPNDICRDDKGNLYVADQDNYTIRKITPSGVVTTIAGNGKNGVSDGTGTNAGFGFISGICFDPFGNLIVSDSNRIRKITPAGVVTTVAGSGGQGAHDDMGIKASFNVILGVCVDNKGNIYAADTANGLIRKIDASGNVTTIAGGVIGYADGTGTSAQFHNPESICIDQQGNLYVSDAANHSIRKITEAGVVTTFAGNGSTRGSADGQGAAASFDGPGQLTMNTDGNIYAADLENNIIRKITSGGLVTTVASNGKRGYADGNGGIAEFYFPYGICPGAANELFVTDKGNNLVRKVVLN